MATLPRPTVAIILSAVGGAGGALVVFLWLEAWVTVQGYPSFVARWFYGPNIVEVLQLLIILVAISLLIVAGLLWRGAYDRKKLAIIIIILSIIGLNILGLIGGVLAYPFKRPQEVAKETRICMGCGATINKEFKWCPECGRMQIEPKITCPKCGQITASSMKFCPNCGNKF